MIPVLLAALHVTFWLTQASCADVQITVNVSQADQSVAQQVNYRRGEVIAFDSSNTSSTPSEIVSFINRDIQSARINLVTATLNLNSDSDESFFDYSAGPPMSLTPDLGGSGTLIRTFSELRSSLNATQLPAIVQLSGTPSAFSQEVNQNYEFVCGGQGNFYPLPLPGNPTSLAQSAISRWIEGVSKNISGAIWIGTQEPTHTLGFSKAYDPMDKGCSQPNSSELQYGMRLNINRFISFWTPIAQSIRNESMKSGGIQANSGNSVDYVFAAKRIISAGMPLDYFTIQNYSPSSMVVQAAYAAYQQFQSASAYRTVKVMMDRYGLSLSGYNYTDARGMMQYLIFESQLMQHADMLYGYSVEESGLHTTNTLLPPVLTWLQGAPAPLRPLTSSHATVQGFALVQTSGSASGRIAVWNNGNSSIAENVSLALTGYPQALSLADVIILKGSGQAILPYNSTSLSITENLISGLSLGPDEFFLLSI